MKRQKLSINPTSMPAYMGFTLQNISILNITDEQKQNLLSLKKTIMSTAHPIKEGITKLEEDIQKLWLNKADEKDIKEVLLQYEKERINFADIKIVCRDKVKELISEEQWNNIVEQYSTKRGYEIDASFENISPIHQNNTVGNINEGFLNSTCDLRNSITKKEKESQEMSMQSRDYDDVMKMIKELEHERFQLGVLCVSSR